MFVFPGERQALQGMPGRGLCAPSHTPERVIVDLDRLLAFYNHFTKPYAPSSRVKSVVCE